MFKSNKDSNLQKDSDNLTIIGEDAKIEGNFISEGDATICGSVDGDIEVNGRLIIGEKAKIKANIKAEDVAINGFVEGNVISDTNVSISAQGNLVGDITLSGNFTIEPGAVFIGNSKMQEKEAESTTDEISDDDLDLDLD